MNYAVIKKNDIANGKGVRVSIFVSGCRHHCEGCFNAVAWDFNYGEKYTKNTENEIIDALSPSFVAGLSLLGGEPFEPENQSELASLCIAVKEKLPSKDIWCYTGFLFEDIISGKVGEKQTAIKLLENIDVLVDGKYVKELHSPALLFRGSSNQRIIDVKKSLEQCKVVLLEGVWERKMGSGNIDE